MVEPESMALELKLPSSFYDMTSLGLVTRRQRVYALFGRVVGRKLRASFFNSHREIALGHFLAHTIAHDHRTPNVKIEKKSVPKRILDAGCRSQD